MCRSGENVNQIPFTRITTENPSSGQLNYEFTQSRDFVWTCVQSLLSLTILFWFSKSSVNSYLILPFFPEISFIFLSNEFFIEFKVDLFSDQVTFFPKLLKNLNIILRKMSGSNFLTNLIKKKFFQCNKFYFCLMLLIKRFEFCFCCFFSVEK